MSKEILILQFYGRKNIILNDWTLTLGDLSELLHDQNLDFSDITHMSIKTYDEGLDEIF